MNPFLRDVVFGKHQDIPDIRETMQEFYDKFKDYIAPGDWSLDIGANCGDSSFPMYALTGDEGIVICFEPNPELFEMLEKNVLNNGLAAAIDVYRYAAADKDGVLEFVYGNSNTNGGIIEGFSVEERGTEGRIRSVDCVDISKFLLDIYGEEKLSDKLSFVKIDTEGYDGNVLLALAEVITIARPVIMCEWWFHKSKNDFLFDAIERIGYRAYRTDNKQETNRDEFSNKSHDLLLMPKN